jgi:hypothetical protein
MEQFGERLEAALREEDESACLQRLGELVLSWYVDDPRLIRLLLFSALEGHELAEIWHEQAFKMFFGPFTEKMGRTADAGRLKDVGADVLVRAFVGMVGHYGMMTAVFKYPEFKMSREVVVSKFVEIFLAGAGRR